jgi:hypothetical protein
VTAISYREYKLLCDWPGCYRDFGWMQREISRADVRKLAVKVGWTHVHEPGAARNWDKDFCPLHKPETEAKP